MLSVILLGGVLLGLCLVGVYEKRRNTQNLESIPLRINVNGIRGKSTVTRLTTSVLAAGGFNVVGKTTGTAARMIYPGKEEVPVRRRPEGANIKEQIKCLDQAAKYGADAMVFECMALKPEYQELVQRDMVRANVYVVVNVLEDHLDVMGPTTREIAQVFSKSIPQNGVMVTVPGEHLGIFEAECARRNCRLVLADESQVDPEFLSEFSYELFPANVALVYAIADVLGISRSDADKGMLQALPDPGALRIVRIDDPDITFVNGFAANEPASSLAIWERMESKGLTDGPVYVLFNGRPDRVDRTDQFVEDFFPLIPKPTVVIGMGKGIKRLRRAFEKGRLNKVSQYVDLEGKPAFEVNELLKTVPSGATVLGVGNIHGDAVELIDLLNKGIASDAGDVMPSIAATERKTPLEILKGKAWSLRS